MEFLLFALEIVDREWEERFLKEITALETINALEIIERSGEEVVGKQNGDKKNIINQSIENLKDLVNESLCRQT